MKKGNLNRFIGNENQSVVDAMNKIDANAEGILFVVNEDQQLVGSLTDGDIRRWIIKFGGIEVQIKEVMNKKPISVGSDDKVDLLAMMKDKSIRAIPIVDDNKQIVDIIFSSDKDVNYTNKGSLEDVSVIVMAGGKGTRLYPYTKILPKPLVPIGDTPIIERVINQYTEFGINSFYITVNYKKAMIKSYFEDLQKEYTIKYVEEEKPLGTGGSIKLINDKFSTPVFVTNCDSLIMADYYDLYQYHMKSNNDITVVSALKNFQIPYGVLQMSENGRIEVMREKPKLSYFINTGMYVINPNIIELIPDNAIFHMTQLVEKVMEIGGVVGTYPIGEDSFLDMGEIDEMKRMEEKLGIKA